MQSAIGKFWTAYFDFNVLGVKWGRFGLRTRLARRRSEIEYVQSSRGKRGLRSAQPPELGCNG